MNRSHVTRTDLPIFYEHAWASVAVETWCLKDDAKEPKSQRLQDQIGRQHSEILRRIRGDKN